MKNVQDFQHAASKIGFTFNWLYADDKDIGYFNSGDNPQRAAGVSFAAPNWGTGEWDWKNFNASNQTASYTPFAEHPQAINQSYLTSWNNKQAPGFAAADGNWSYGPLYRSQMLDLQIDRRLAGGAKMSLAELIDSMEAAGTVDLRGERDAILMMRVIGQSSDPDVAEAIRKLSIWLYKGSHRIDRNKDGHYEDEDAIQIMDAWWPRAVQAMYEPVLGTPLYNKIQGCRGAGQRAQQPRRAPRQRVPGRLVRLREQGPAQASRRPGAAALLTRVLRQRQPGAVPHRAGRLAQGRPRRAEDHALHGQRLHRRRPALLRRGPLPRHRRYRRCPRSPGSTGRPSSRSCRSRPPPR